MLGSPQSGRANLLLGSAAIVRFAYEGGDLNKLFQDIQQSIAADPTNGTGYLDAATLLLVAGQPKAAKDLLAIALGFQRCFPLVHGTGDGLRILVFKVAGDLMANTPVEFLLEGSDAVLLAYYVDAQTPHLDDLPPHDVAMIAIAESQANRPVLDNLSRLLAGWSGPIINGRPERIAALTRMGVATALADEPSLAVAALQCMDRGTLEVTARNAPGMSPQLPGGGFPVLVRPLDSHAGQGLAKIDSEPGLAGYLASHADAQFYVTQFVDYRSRDGLYRKYRVAVIDGVAYPSHLAISDHWMVHYLNAAMDVHASRRAEEARWMESFESDFGQRHAAGFAALANRLGLDYFAIDCSETSDGRLLVFEADVAMIVHALDPAETYAYKKPAMKKLFGAFLAALERRHACARQLASEASAPRAIADLAGSPALAGEAASRREPVLETGAP